MFNRYMNISHTEFGQMYPFERDLDAIIFEEFREKEKQNDNDN